MNKDKEHDMLKILKEINLEKLSTKQVELIEIVYKCGFYKKKCIYWYLKPLYQLAYFLILFIAKKEGGLVR